MKFVSCCVPQYFRGEEGGDREKDQAELNPLHRLKISIMPGGPAGNPLLCTLNSLRTKNKVLKHFFCLKSLNIRRMKVPAQQVGKNHCKVQVISASLGYTEGYRK